MKKIDVDFFMEVKMISHLKKFHDKLLVIGKQASKEKNTYLSNLYMVEGNGLRQLTFSNDVGDYEIVEDTIVFRSSRDDSKTCDLYALPVFGEAYKLFSLDYKVRNIYFITKNHFLFTATTNLPSVTFEEGEECRVFEEVPWWFNGAGDISKTRGSLFEYNQGEVIQISQADMNVGNVVFTPDHKQALVTAKAWKNYNGFTNHLYLYNVENRQLTLLDPFGECGYHSIDFKDNNIVILDINRMNRMDGMENGSFYIYHLDTKKITLLYDQDPYGNGSSEGSDIQMGVVGCDLLFDDTGFAYITTAVDHAPLVHLDYQGNITFVTKNKEMIQEAIKAEEGYYFIMMDEDKPNEIYSFKNGVMKQITRINSHLVEEYSISTPIEMNFKNKEGMELNGWVMKPVDFEEGKKYPTILDVHGGPKTIYGPHFFHEMQYWANAGYAVIFTNIHGSDGRGNKFCDIRGIYGTIDYDDLMSFVDSAIEQFDFIDERHMGITGGSYGGFMTNWVIGHTNRFKAAASQRSISNWISFANISDIGYDFGKLNNQATTWDNVELMWQQSPLKYADKCTTPTLFIHSDHDYRCPMAEGMQMFYALKVHGVDARMCLFKDETHELSRSGRPMNRIRRLKEITVWMDHYLKGQENQHESTKSHDCN